MNEFNEWIKEEIDSLKAFIQSIIKICVPSEEESF